MALEVTPIDRVANIDRDSFQSRYARQSRPLVIEGLSRFWPAYNKWTLDYFKSVCGDTVVPLYDGSKADASKKVNEPAARMKFSEYLDLIASGPTDLRMFTFNVVDHLPQVKTDFIKPDLCRFFVDRFPMMFFGGQGSKVFLHYDIDVPHIFLTQFHGSKRVLLFPPKCTPRLYKLPLSWHAIEDIDWWNPDLEKYPALRGVKGMTTILKHGETLYMPPGWWHYMEYIEGGFAVALRAVSLPWRIFEGIWNVTIVRTVDNLLRKHVGRKWFDYKERRAYEKSNQYALRHVLPEADQAPVI
ncbi:MAG TPA: cupin-like domain-containing protein [Tepidisphaeraceae bacterium]|nr:cupin-like domain-containing protein [Tepidisphaeraceae bacterium]